LCLNICVPDWTIEDLEIRFFISAQSTSFVCTLVSGIAALHLILDHPSFRFLVLHLLPALLPSTVSFFVFLVHLTVWTEIHIVSKLQALCSCSFNCLDRKGQGSVFFFFLLRPFRENKTLAKFTRRFYQFRLESYVF